MIAAASLGLSAARTINTRQDWLRFKPVWWLKIDLASSALQTQRNADIELRRRHAGGELSLAQERSVALMPPIPSTRRPSLYLKAKKFVPSICVDFAAELRRKGLLSDGDWSQCAGHVIGTSLEVRNPIRQGDPIVIRLGCGWNGVASRDATIVTCKSLSAKIDGESAPISMIQMSMRNLPNWAVQGGGNDTGIVSPPLGTPLSVGRHSLSIKVQVALKITSSASHPDARTWWQGQIELTSALNIVPPETETVERITDPQMRDAVRNCLAPVEESGPLRFGSQTRAPIDLSFDVYLRADRHEYYLRGLSIPKNATISWELGELPSGCHAKMGDVIYRPSPREALREFDMRRIWGDEVVFHDVKFIPQNPQ